MKGINYEVHCVAFPGRLMLYIGLNYYFFLSSVFLNTSSLCSLFMMRDHAMRNQNGVRAVNTYILCVL
jgi:hypothetical protein